MSIIREIRDEVVALYNVFKCEIIRIAILIIIGLALLQPDKPTMALITYSFGLSFLLIAASHIARKILFRRMDIAELAQSAMKDQNLASAVVFAAICFVLVALMYIMAAPLLR